MPNKNFNEVSGQIIGEKLHWKPGTMIYPAPAVLISCGKEPETHNLFTVSWVGTVCTNPAMLSISVRPERHSYNLIKESGEFVVNLTTKKLLRATDYCGVRSGKNENKWESSKVKTYPSKIVSAPQVADSPVSIECQVDQIIPLGSHDLFISKVVNVSVLPELLDENGAYRLDKAELIGYIHGGYCEFSKVIDTFGFSVRKKKKKKAKGPFVPKF